MKCSISNLDGGYYRLVLDGESPNDELLLDMLTDQAGSPFSSQEDGVVAITSPREVVQRSAGVRKGKRRLSAAGRQRIAAAQKKRWAAFHKAKGKRSDA